VHKVRGGENGLQDIDREGGETAKLENDVNWNYTVKIKRGDKNSKGVCYTKVPWQGEQDLHQKGKKERGGDEKKVPPGYQKTSFIQKQRH